MQWRQMDWPVLWDPFNSMEFPAVPVTYLLDPAGKVLVVQPALARADQLRDRLRSRFGDLRTSEPRTATVSRSEREPAASPGTGAEPPDWSDHAVSLVLWDGADRLEEAVEAARRAVEESDDPVMWFRLGVVLRRRHDSPRRQPGDFANAVDAWSRALDADPNQYIWRRRLQQYGPRLAKPYPFYDWVPRARGDIESRGEVPVELMVEPHGAEFAEPASGTEADGAREAGPEPDPDGRVWADEVPLIGVETVMIPPRPRPGDTVRVHLVLTPDRSRDAHWNNEAGHGELWVDPPPGWQATDRHQLMEVGSGDVSDETRRLEFEIAAPADADVTATLHGYLLYYVCEGAAGVCLYRRQDLEIPITVSGRHQTAGLAG